MTRWLVEFGYDGVPFAGWARQPGLRTVEGEILRGLGQCGALSGPSTHIDVASRTDRGVSARANAMAIETALPGPSLLGALNGIAPQIFFRRARRIPDGFRVREASWREYRYFLPPHGWEKDPPRELLERFVAGPVDVRSFGRGVPGGAPCWRTITYLGIEGRPAARVLRIRAPSFVWGMVRKIVGALGEVSQGRLTSEEVMAAIAGRARLPVPPAPAAPLVLWQVAYPLRWEVQAYRPTRGQSAYFRGELEATRSRGVVLTRIREAMAPERPLTRGGVGDGKTPVKSR